MAQIVGIVKKKKKKYIRWYLGVFKSAVAVVFAVIAKQNPPPGR